MLPSVRFHRPADKARCVRIDLDRVANAVAGIGVLTEEAMAPRLDEGHRMSIESNGMKTLYCHFFVPLYLPNELDHRKSFIN